MPRLVKLELENFKSYKGKQIIGPFYDFTSVIGPNGAGKSNLMDAISFVLGVSSAHLRSTNLKELIYSGHEEGKNVKGRPSLSASVKAFYNDAEGEEYTFSRIITPSGVSEYKLNGKIVSAADYNDWLASQNILVKARNFLVFQGDVEAVAAKSPKELAKLIDQISGAEEFKEEYEKLKELQLNALEKSTFALTRKRGINAEIKQVKEQKEESALFEKYMDEKSAILLEYMLWKLFHIEQQVNEAQTDLAGKSQQVAQLNASMEEVNEEFKEARKQQSVAFKESLALEKRLKKLQDSKYGRNPETFKNEEQIKYVEDKISKLEQEKTKVTDEKSNTEKEIEKLSSELRLVEVAKNNFEEELQRDGKSVLSEAQMKEFEEIKAQVHQQFSKQKYEISQLESKLNPLLAERDNLQMNLDEKSKTKNQLQEELVVVSRRLSRLMEAISAADRKYKEFVHEKQNVINRRHQIEKAEKSHNEELEDILQQLLRIKVDRKESERELKYGRMLESLKRIFPGVHGKLSDLCKPTKKKYDQASMIALGQNMDSIIVTEEKIALECINYLKEQQLGQATFLPLDSIKFKEDSQRLRSLTDKTVVLASDILDCDPIYKPAVLYACSNVLICDNLKLAKEIAYNREEKAKIITVDGTVIHKSGMITGGANTKAITGGNRWEEKEVDALRKNRDTISSKLHELAQEKKSLKNDEVLQEEILACENKLSFLNEEKEALQKKLDGINAQIAHIEQESVIYNKELNKINENCSKIQENVDQLNVVIEEAFKDALVPLSKKVKIPDLLERMKSLQDINKNVVAKRFQFEANISKLKNLVTYDNELLGRLADRINDIDNSIEEERQALYDLQVIQQNIQDSIRDSTKEEKDCEAAMNDNKKVTEEISMAMNRLRKKQQKLRHDLDLMTKSISSDELHVEKLLEERSSILRKCRLEEISLPLNRGSLDNVSFEEENWDPSSVVIDYSKLPRESKQSNSEAIEYQYTEKMHTVDMEIEKIAPNLRSMDKLDSAENRLKQVLDSFEDIRKEAKVAREKFLEVKRRRHTRFMSAFNHIKEKISHIYKDLTKSPVMPIGGSAFFELEDEDEPFSQGIKYNVMPPGKRFHEMSQLSGGEKTMAALALLFAIHSYRPAPFFVLDEIDAALDNANVQRITSYLQSQSSTLQLIVISLKSSLYEKSEALVGVYRDIEIQSSRILTLKLSDYGEDGQDGDENE